MSRNRDTALLFPQLIGMAHQLGTPYHSAIVCMYIPRAGPRRSFVAEEEATTKSPLAVAALLRSKSNKPRLTPRSDGVNSQDDRRKDFSVLWRPLRRYGVYPMRSAKRAGSCFRTVPSQKRDHNGFSHSLSPSCLLRVSMRARLAVRILWSI